MKGIYKHANWPVDNRVWGSFEFVCAGKNCFEWVDKIWAGLGSVLFNVFALILPVFLGNASIFILFCHHYLVLRN